jgi:hypothetical protein
MTGEKRSSGVLLGCVALAAVGVLSFGGVSQATTVPLPTGVVTGKQSFSYYQCPVYCGYVTIVRDFKNVRAVGRVTVAGRGMQIVVSATPMHFESYQYFCPNGCGPTTPALAAPFTITGTTGGGSHFSATCTSGSIREALQDSEIGIGPMVSTFCEGGTSSSSGEFAFRFLMPEDIPGLVEVNSPFAAFLVEA